MTITDDTICAVCLNDYGSHRAKDDACPSEKRKHTYSTTNRFKLGTDTCESCGEVGVTCICFNCSQDICDNCNPNTDECQGCSGQGFEDDVGEDSST